MSPNGQRFSKKPLPAGAHAYRLSMSKDARITLRLPQSLRTQLEEVCRLTGLDEPLIIRACIEAFVEAVARDGEIRLPIALVSKRWLEQAKPLPEKPPPRSRKGPQ